MLLHERSYETELCKQKFGAVLEVAIAAFSRLVTNMTGAFGQPSMTCSPVWQIINISPLSSASSRSFTASLICPTTAV